MRFAIQRYFIITLIAFLLLLLLLLLSPSFPPSPPLTAGPPMTSTALPGMTDISDSGAYGIDSRLSVSTWKPPPGTHWVKDSFLPFLLSLFLPFLKSPLRFLSLSFLCLFCVFFTVRFIVLCFSPPLLSSLSFFLSPFPVLLTHSSYTCSFFLSLIPHHQVLLLQSWR